jgi:hypothetical protein
MTGACVPHVTYGNDAWPNPFEHFLNSIVTASYLKRRRDLNHGY